VFSSSPPVLNSLEGRDFATAESKLTVKFVVDGDARRSCPAGGSAAKSPQGDASLQAMCSGWEADMAAVCPCGRSTCQWQHYLQVAMGFRDRCIYLDQYVNTTLVRWSEHGNEY
jgi:hypothetical protein